MEITKGNLLQKYEAFSDHWHPRVIAELNGQAVKIAKVKGEFIWHSHEEEDEMFYVVKGVLKIELRDQLLELKEGEYAVIPKGVEHRPIADDEVYILMFEPVETINTGNLNNEMTKQDLEKI